MAIRIDDPDVRAKIAAVEGEEWLKQDEQTERDGGRRTMDVSVANALGHMRGRGAA